MNGSSAMIKTKLQEKQKDLILDTFQYFFPTKDKKDSEHQFPIVKISKVIQNQGIPKTHLREALAVLIGMLSSKLGDPVPVAITEEEGAGAIQLIDTCLNLMPDDAWIEVSNKSAIAGNGSLEGKTLISYNGDSLKDILLPILLKVERWNEKRFRKINSEIGENGLNSFVVLIKNLNNPILQNPYVTRIHIGTDATSKRHRLESLESKYDLITSKLLEIETACMRTFLKRIIDCPVKIDFSNQIVDQTALNMPNLVPIYDLALRIIRNLTRINGIPSPEEYELYTYFIGLNILDLVVQDEHMTNKSKIATKLDYYYFKLIFEDILTNLNDFITPRQLRVFNAIFTYIKAEIPLRDQKKKAELTPFDLLKLVRSASTVSAWPDRDEIMEIVNSDGGDTLTDSTLFNELKLLTKQRIIVEDKRPGRRRARNVYAINQVPFIPIIATEDASKIYDPVFNGSEVEVINFMTDEVEKI
jgi:hypothetical protein